MDLQARAHMEMVHLNLMMTAGVGGRFDWLPEERKRQADAAIFIRHDLKNATPEYLGIMSKADEFGFWAFHAKEMTYGKKGPRYHDLFKHTAKSVIAGKPYGSLRDYQNSFRSAFEAVESKGASTRDFIVEFLFQARRTKKDHFLKPLLWKLPGDTGNYARAQEALLKVFNEQEGFADFMRRNLSRSTIRNLTLEYTLDALVRCLDRKGRGQLLHDQLGI